VTCTGDNHFSAAENQADNLRIVKSVNQAWELFWFVLDLVEGQVEGEVVEVEFTRDSSERFVGKFVVSILVFWVVKCIGCNHVLNFNFDLVQVPSFNSSITEVCNHSFDSSFDVCFVFTTGTNCTTGSEHEDSKFWIGDSVNDTRELLWFVFN